MRVLQTDTVRRWEQRNGWALAVGGLSGGLLLLLCSVPVRGQEAPSWFLTCMRSTQLYLPSAHASQPIFGNLKTPTPRPGPFRPLPPEIGPLRPATDLYSGCVVRDVQWKAGSACPSTIMTIVYNDRSQYVDAWYDRDLDGTIDVRDVWWYDPKRHLLVRRELDNTGPDGRADGVVDSLTVWEYNDEDDPTVIRSIDGSGILDSEIVHQYTESGALTLRRTEVGADRELQREWQYNYHPDGRLQSYRVRGGVSVYGSTTWNGDDLVRLDESAFEGSRVRFVNHMTYDTEHRLTWFGQDYDADGDIDAYQTFVYNQYGWLIREDTWRGHPEWWLRYAYNDLGQLIARWNPSGDHRYLIDCPE